MLENIKIENKNGEMVVSSREVAENFEKEHSKVLRTIQEKIEVSPILASPKYFIESTYTDKSNRQSKEYLMTRDGFSFLVMGFTGAKADEWKLRYIEAFNKMERHITKQLNDVKLEAQNKNAEARLKNAKVKEANFVLDTIEKYDLSSISKDLLVINALEVVLGENKLPRPKLEERYYTATEIGKELGISSKAVGSIAIQNNLKTSEYGIEVLDKSRYSNKQLPTFRYNEKGRQKIKELFEGGTL